MRIVTTRNKVRKPLSLAISAIMIASLAVGIFLISAPLATAANIDLTPDYAKPGATGVPMIEFDVTNAGTANGTFMGVTVSSIGTVLTDVDTLYVIRKADEAVVGSATFGTSPITIIFDPAETITAGTTVSYKLAVDIATGATGGNTVDVQLDSITVGGEADSDVKATITLPFNPDGSTIIDAVAPTISATSPATGAYIKAEFTVGYTLDEAVASGTIKFTTDGTTQTYTLSEGELTLGAHEIAEATLNAAAVSLADGTVYSIAFDATDPAGNDATTVTNADITYDTTAPTVAITYNQGGKTTSPFKAGTLTITATFSEAPAGTPQITIDQQGTMDITVTDMTGSGTTRTYEYTIYADTGDTYIDGDATITISNGADAAGNPNEEATNKIFTIDTMTPEITSMAPASSSSVNHTKVSYTLSEDVASGTITWTWTSGSADDDSPHTQALAGEELGAGAHADITLTDDPTLVDGATYSIAFDVTDAAGNAATTVTSTDVTYDTTAPTMDSAQTKTTTTIDVTFSEDIDDATITLSDFSVTGNTVSGAVEDTAGVVILTLGSEIATDAIPSVIYTQGTLADPAGNLVGTTTVIPSDGIAPVIVEFEAQLGSWKATVKFSEGVYTDSAFVIVNDGTAEWTTEGAHSESYSVKLTAPTVADYAKVKMPLSVAFSSITDLSFYYMISGDAERTVEDIGATWPLYVRSGETVAEGYLSPYLVINITDGTTPLSIISQSWTESVITGTWIKWSNTQASQHWTEACWHNESFDDLPGGPEDAGWEPLSAWIAHYNDFEVVDVGIGLGFFNMTGQQSAYVDDLAVDSVTYDFDDTYDFNLNPLVAGDFAYSPGIDGVSHIAGEDLAVVELAAQVTSTNIDSDTINAVAGRILDIHGNAALATTVEMADERNALSLVDGWNLVSIPKIPSDGWDIISNAPDLLHVYTYDDGSWNTDVSDADSLDAVFIKANGPQELALSWTTSMQTTPPIKELEEGWNLIGTNMDTTRVDPDAEILVLVTEFLDSVAESWSTVFSPNFNLKSWTVTSGEASIEERVLSYEGYWIYMTAADELAGRTT